jgi:hypothetical protein
VRLRSFQICFALLLLAALPTRHAHAQADFVNARTLGMGEALRANAAGTAAPMINPAGMSLSKGYNIEADYGIDIEQLGHHVYVGIVDSITSRVAAGLYYEYIHAEPKLGFYWAGGRIPNDTLTRSGHAAGLSLSTALGEKFLLGATVKYLYFNTTAPLPMGIVPSSLSLDHVNGVTFDVGLLVRVIPKFNLAATGMNLWNHGSQETATSLGLAAAVIPIPSLSIDFDALVNFTGYKRAIYEPDNPLVVKSFAFHATARLGPGIEYLIANKVPIRAGVIYDTGLTATYVSVGSGYMGQSFAIDVSYRAKVSGGVENFVMIGLRYFPH